LAATQITKEKRLEVVLLKIKNRVNCGWSIGWGKSMAFAAVVWPNEVIEDNKVMTVWY